MTEHEQSRTRRTTTILVVGGLLVLLALAWLLDALAGQAAADYRVVVRRDGAELRSYSLEDLRRFESHKFTQSGLTEEGPSVRDVLSDAGVEDFARLTVVGLGIKDDGLLVLDADQVDEDVLLDFANRGTVKIAGPNITRAERVRDVTELRVD